MLLSRARFLIAVLVLPALLWLAAFVTLGRHLKVWEGAAIVVACPVLLAWLRGRQLRRERQELESMRDSALW
ncbi:hypothetical protein [Ramlibacter tataouinensis]|uniref:hypothetical protein n=1 Tax=Ramlibacter tataouinensis TaxID=94132 RepID=UPI00117C6CE7|nr:hypothetical protein [Ramlibacter tataouinensis]